MAYQWCDKCKLLGSAKRPVRMYKPIGYFHKDCYAIRNLNPAVISYQKLRNFDSFKMEIDGLSVSFSRLPSTMQFRYGGANFSRIGELLRALVKTGSKKIFLHMS